MLTSQEHLDHLLAAVGDAHSVLIMPHVDPDPDAIASAVALHHLLVEIRGVTSHIAYKGMIGRAENKALVHYLHHPLRQFAGSVPCGSTLIALVDTQPGTGNNALPAECTAAIVFDHHPWREATAAATFADVRPDTGATSTILTEYLQAAGIEPTPQLATALFYGIKSDTMGLVRGASPADAAAYFHLQRRIDVDALLGIERAQVPVEYFQKVNVALHSARVYGDVVIAYIGAMHYPDLAAEMADLLLRLEGTRWVVCLGVHKGELILAARTRARRGGAGALMQAVVADRGTAGGHGTMAGGHVPLAGRNAEELGSQLGQRALELLKSPAKTNGRPFLE